MNAQTIKENWPLVVGGVVVLIGLFYALAPGTQSTSYQTIAPSGPSSDPSAVALAQANLQASEQHDALIGGLFGKLMDQSHEVDMANIGVRLQEEKDALTSFQTQESAMTAQVLSANQADAAKAAAHDAMISNFWHDLFNGGASAASSYYGAQK